MENSSNVCSEYAMLDDNKIRERAYIAIDYKRDDHRHATSWVIRECLKNRYISPSRSFKPKNIVQDVKEKFRVQISDDKAWRARDAAYATLHGTPEESYTFLPFFTHILKEKNPGTVIDLVLTNESRFTYFLMALAASVQGYPYCRPVVYVDGVHLKGKYKGMMFTAVCKDGNNSIFPLAWGIGDTKDDASWLWFFTKFRDVYGHRPDLFIVLDGHPSIAKAIQQVYPNAFHAICMQHLLQNLKTKFRGLAIDMLYYQCMKAYCMFEFEQLMHALTLVDPRIKTYLQDIGFEKWYRAYSESRRHNIMTTNIAKCINDVLLSERKLPITTLAEGMRFILQCWHFERWMDKGQ